MRIGIVALLLVVSAFAIGCGNEALVEVTPAVNAAGDAQGTKTDLDLQKAKELYEAGLAFFAQGQMEEAIRKYDEAIRLSSDTPGAYAGRGLAYSNLGQFLRAVQDFDAAIRLNPQNADAYNNRGLAFGELGDFNKAVQDFDASIRLNPQRADAYNNRGLAYGELGD
ncbi:MAG: tetratricopeptide repeat protein, partial [Chloroflexi bacterium]|nr:tetratricopeptide repeat protein [Chloroflexota bacterium]